MSEASIADTPYGRYVTSGGWFVLNFGEALAVRNEEKGGQSIFHLNARTATAIAMADGFALRPKDVVYVDPVPLVQWNRVLNLILPTTSYGYSYLYRGGTNSGGVR